jgi:hypothetical protein
VRYRRVAVGERCCACVVGGGGGGGRWQSMLRTSATRALRSCVSQSQCRTALVYEPAATVTPWWKCCVCPREWLRWTLLLAVVDGCACRAPVVCYSLVTSTFSVQCGGVCSCGAVCSGVSVHVGHCW